MGELAERQAVLEAMFQQYDTENSGELTPNQLQALHSSIRFGGISLPQVKAAMCYTCMCDDVACEQDELFDVLQEMDRRYFLVQDFRWEFSLLDAHQSDFITEDQGSSILMKVGVDQEEKLKTEMNEKLKQKEEEERGKKEAEERERLDKERRDREEAERQRELEIIEVQQALEAQRELEKKAKELEEQKKRELEEAKDDEEQAKLAAEREKIAEEEAKKAREAAKLAKDAASRQEAEEAEKAAREKAKQERNQKIRRELKVAIKKRDKKMLVKSVENFKNAKLADTDKDLPKAEKILKLFKAKDDLEDAMERRNLEDLEKSINFVKKNTFEADLPHEMIRANKMLINLKRLKRLRDEILNLKQSTVAEIRSYSKPPRVVHQVMIGTYLLLGNKEKTLKDWKGMQALIGKTGKDGLKRRVMEFKLETSDTGIAERSKAILDEFDLETVRDVSAGAAVFYAWGTATIEEIIDYHNQKKDGEDVSGKESGAKKTIKLSTQSGTLTVKI
ncbi:calponin homology domain-containing protein DDB_G0272472-like [Anneissia japonica]|uniref:calponin homology domain-containing protein DDB_G0272472-like n=2 Tax=Anneissia japonica TaxID=1529436 RepID=UPI0014257564|nr:calponin homology domain-containing protein DDB_G0272472-like [Anneissia japonica]